MITPLAGGRRLFPNLKFNFRNQFNRNFNNNSNIISVEKKRKEFELKSNDNSNINSSESDAPSFLPPADFQYNYEPMSIFEETIGKFH